MVPELEIVVALTKTDAVTMVVQQRIRPLVIQIHAHASNNGQHGPIAIVLAAVDGE